MLYFLYIIRDYGKYDRKQITKRYHRLLQTKWHRGRYVREPKAQARAHDR